MDECSSRLEILLNKHTYAVADRQKCSYFIFYNIYPCDWKIVSPAKGYLSIFLKQKENISLVLRLAKQRMAECQPAVLLLVLVAYLLFNVMGLILGTNCIKLMMFKIKSLSASKDLLLWRKKTTGVAMFFTLSLFY